MHHVNRLSQITEVENAAKLLRQSEVIKEVLDGKVLCEVVQLYKEMMIKPPKRKTYVDVFFEGKFTAEQTAELLRKHYTNETVARQNIEASKSTFVDIAELKRQEKEVMGI